MNTSPNPPSAFLAQLALRQWPFLAAFVLLFLVPHALLTKSILLPLALVSLGVVTVLVDRHTLELVPTAFPTLQSRQAADVFAIGGGVLVGFLALTSAATPGRFGTAATFIVLLRVMALGGLGLFAYASFRDDVFPLLQRLGADTSAFREALRERAALKGVEHRQRQDREAAVRDARNRVVAFYRQHRRRLQVRFHPSWLETEMHARIPDAATDQEAYAAASELIARLEAYLSEGQAQLEAVERQLAEVRAAREALDLDPDLDPELRREELAALAQRERELHGQRSALARAT